MADKYLRDDPRTPEEQEKAYKESMERFRTSLPLYEKCFSCNGRGSTPHWDAGPGGFFCSTCDGRGMATPERNKVAKDAWDSWCEGMKRCNSEGDDGAGLIDMARRIKDDGTMPFEQSLEDHFKGESDT